MSKYTSWVNKDGLVVGFGTRTSVEYGGASVRTDGYNDTVVLKIADMTLLGTDATVGTGIYAPEKVASSVYIPANAVVQEVMIVTDTAATSDGAADLLIGTYTISGTTGALVAVDADGLCAAGDSALADYSVAGETMVLGKAAGAAQIGKVTVGASPVVVAATYVTAAYTAGAITIYVTYTSAR